MKGVAIYIEGGGLFRAEQRSLRVGFDTFMRSLKALAASKDKSFRLVLCGSRDEAYRAFLNERSHESNVHSLLLVDSEEVVTNSLKAHLQNREKHWSLQDVDERDLHGMVTTMETWIVSDPDALKRFYGQHFAADKLPQNQYLELVSKEDVCRCLDAAIGKSSAGRYHKMKHAPKLLTELDLEVVMKRCAHCDTLVNRVKELLMS